MRIPLHGRRVSSWRRLLSVATGSMLVLSMLSAGQALAANPRWVVGYGTDSFFTPQPASGASSSAISAGKKVGFFEWLRNDDTSNISQLYLTAAATPAATVAGATWSIKTATGGVVRAGACPTATPLNCSFGALRSGETVYIVAAFQTASNLVDGTVQGVHFEFKTTGTPGGKNNSHGDAKSIDDAAMVTSNGDAAGDFNLDQPDLTVADNQNVSNANPQATSATVAGSSVGIAVGDSPSLTVPCTNNVPAGFQCNSLTSLVSTVEVGNGKSFSNPNGPGTPGIKVIVTFKKAPSQLGGANPFAYHYFIDPSGAGQVELITAPCVLSGGFPTNAGPCLTVGNNKVTVWLTHNGGLRM